MSLAMIKEVLKGNVKAYETIRDTIGEKPVDKIEVNKVNEKTVMEIELYIQGDGNDSRTN